jgi:hypothetical protein
MERQSHELNGSPNIDQNHPVSHAPLHRHQHRATTLVDQEHDQADERFPMDMDKGSTRGQMPSRLE